MKKIFLIALLALFFVGCEQATIDVPETPAVETPEPDVPDPMKKFFVYNSVWDIVDSGELITTSRAVTGEIPASILAFVESYNAENNDDQLTIETEEIPIEESPTVDVYIVNEGDYVVLAEYLGLDRADFVARRADFAIDERGFGGILFVDKIPPVPIIPPDLRTPHEKYHIQMVNKYDKIVVYNGFRYEESCEETWASFNGTGPDLGYPTVDDYFASRVSGYEMDIRCVGLVPEDAPWRVVSGQIYTEPTE